MLAAGCRASRMCSSRRGRCGGKYATLRPSLSPLLGPQQDQPVLAVGLLDGALRFFTSGGAQKYKDRQLSGGWASSKRHTCVRGLGTAHLQCCSNRLALPGHTLAFPQDTSDPDACVSLFPFWRCALWRCAHHQATPSVSHTSGRSTCWWEARTSEAKSARCTGLSRCLLLAGRSSTQKGVVHNMRTNKLWKRRNHGAGSIVPPTTMPKPPCPPP